eukprot:TRINITY_DN6077_c1_g2_i1.p1 TRINITY_DN6077_c1_g2~~TRINITY_DN6077_c1_g2_i1.p1  ORF type:complete len:544 (+),score=222.25 TRINITY_DN6077_c1_g2_i1:91-1632(+)
MSDPAADGLYLRDSNIPALVNEMMVHLLKARPADPVACLVEWMGSAQCDRGKYGPGKGESAPEAAAPAAAASAPAKEGEEGEEEEDDPGENLHSLSECKGDLEAEIKAAVADGKTRIDISKNRLKAIPSCLSELKAVTSLSVEENQLDPAALELLGQMPQLEYLNISDNPALKVIPEGLGEKLSSLKKIDAFKCGFSGPLSGEVCKMKSLTYINFYNNGLLKAPAEISELTNLTELNLASNKIMAVMPGQLDNFPKLRRLALFWNRLLRLPSLAPLKQLKELQLNGNQLPEMPELGVHESLESINLSENKMTTLHPSLFDQPSLDEFSAGKNQLTNESILTGWAKLPVIRKICLPNNQLTAFPTEFLDLPHLRVLELNSNQITAIPEDIDRFEKKKEPLNHLFLLENKITTLPKAMTECKSFMRLGLKQNPLNATDADTRDVYQAMEALIKSKGIDGKFIDGKRVWKCGAPTGPTSLGLGGNGGADPEVKKKKSRADDGVPAAAGGGVTLAVG